MALHTSKRMHFIEERPAWGMSCFGGSACIRQNVCTSLRTASFRRFPNNEITLHTSKRMHFIEESPLVLIRELEWTCIRQNVCTSLRIPGSATGGPDKMLTCIRQNVCTSLRRRTSGGRRHPHPPCIRQNVCTSLRIRPACRIRQRPLHLHTSKRMHFIEECSS